MNPSLFELLCKLPETFQFMAPVIDVLPAVPVLFLLLAFLWQAAFSFR